MQQALRKFLCVNCIFEIVTGAENSTQKWGGQVMWSGSKLQRGSVERNQLGCMPSRKIASFPTATQ